MSRTLIINESNIVQNTNNSQLKFKFNGSQTFTNNKIALAKLNMYYSWFNITAENGNNIFNYTWMNASGNVASSQSILISDGNYTVEDLDLYIKNEMKKRNHYLISNTSSANDIYFISFSVNPTYYAIELNVSPVPTTLPSGYSKGGTWGLPIAPRTPIVNISNSNNFKSLIGFAPGTYPASVQGSTYVALSSVTPRMSPISALNIRASICSNSGFTNPSDVVYTYSQGNLSFGSLIDQTESNPFFIKITDGTYSEITFSISDQNYNPVKILDPQMILVFLII